MYSWSNISFEVFFGPRGESSKRSPRRRDAIGRSPSAAPPTDPNLGRPPEPGLAVDLAREIGNEVHPVQLVGGGEAGVELGAKAIAMVDADLAILEQPARTRGKCSPEPSGVLLATSSSGAAPRVELETKAMPERGNACAHLGALTVHLRPQDEAESQSAASTAETLTRVDRR